MGDTTKIAPNPFSPYANADLNLRHAFPAFFGAVPDHGVLTVTGCRRMAVVAESTPRDVLDEIAAGSLPEGMCPVCVKAATEGEQGISSLPAQRCRECGGDSSQGEWCALCRQELHDIWWATRGEGHGGEVFSR
ncbi:hypothetical protein [Nonomuraea rubra]|uniref:Uncharacterized protein n=1 Tax=Nonomuraea rubra TaxID=46180 RepID=A0A7X0P6K9_9ACTN|nr:hypothetical protein [Nonomuraea rubra]MBB6556211.1 hypothetical protein [Nonomuraea rubra]